MEKEKRRESLLLNRKRERGDWRAEQQEERSAEDVVTRALQQTVICRGAVACLHKLQIIHNF